jgi:hypothetical protein
MMMMWMEKSALPGRRLLAPTGGGDGGAILPTQISQIFDRDRGGLSGILLQTAQSAGVAGFIIATTSPDLAIIDRNSCAATLIPTTQRHFAEAGCFARMTFHDLHSHLLLVGVSGETHCGQLSLIGDPSASRRQAAILIVPVPAGDQRNTATSGKVMLLIGAPLSWLDNNNWTVADEHPADTILRLCEKNTGRAGDGCWG